MNGNAIARTVGPIIVSILILTTFGILAHLVLTKAIPDSNKDAANIILGALAAMSSSVVAYWIQSNASSGHKDDIIAASTPAGATVSVVASDPKDGKQP